MNLTEAIPGTMNQNAFVLRIAPAGIDKVHEALESDQIMIGWSHARGLLDETLPWADFRGVVQNTFYPDEPALRKAGAAAGNIWRFLREMKAGDLVVVPHETNFYVAQITGPAVYLDHKVDDDTAYRRQVVWQNGKKPIPRQQARSALLSRMKIQGTSSYATDVISEIKECLEHAAHGKTHDFEEDLKKRLVNEVLAEIRNGRIDSYGFERLIETVLLGLGAVECTIIPRNSDKGADLVASFRVAGAFQQRVAVQAKHWQPEPPVDSRVVEQLIRGIEAEGANLGMVITSGAISKEAFQTAQHYSEESGIRIELVDGEQFAKLIVEHGVGARQQPGKASFAPG